MNTQTVLIVDDDPKTRTLLRTVLEGDGFFVIEATNTASTLKALVENPVSLMTLDIKLGNENGLDLARDIRRRYTVPIVMLTEKGDVIDRIVGLEVGADDYITKPFHVREVIARIRCVLRRTEGDTSMEHPAPDAGGRSGSEHSQNFYFDGMTAIPNRLELIDRNNLDCRLTSGDFKLLSVFLDRPNRALSRDQLMDLTGGVAWSPLDRTIDNQVARLRKKIERVPSRPKLIKTVRGIGYMLACDVQKRHSSEPNSKNA